MDRPRRRATPVVPALARPPREYDFGHSIFFSKICFLKKIFHNWKILSLSLSSPNKKNELQLWKPSSLRETVEFQHYVNNELCDENVSAASNMTSKTDDDNMEVDEDHMELAPDEDSNSRPVELSKNADVAKIRRNILAAKPRVTRYIINWDDDAEEATTTAA